MIKPPCVGSACARRATELIEETRWGEDTPRALALALRALAYAAHDPAMWATVVRALRDSSNQSPGVGDNDLRSRLAALAEAIHPRT